ncbi:hypothetical protein V1278_003802 [Bradyrhizobium sp. AZCC 1577]|uniref:hypothetical protein n=1 Tax=unclassified Bradyrhizobium TaxID=2631580 RepID=UPI002FF06691
MKPDFYSPDSKCEQAYKRWVASPMYKPINADAVLAAARRHEKYMRTALHRDYEMRVFEDGSVFFRNTEIPGLERLFSFEQIQEATRDLFWSDPHRSLWQHIAALWL